MSVSQLQTKTLELDKLKKWAIPIVLVSLCIAGLVLVLTLVTVYEWGWGTQGVAKALVVGGCVSIIFILFAMISLNFYRKPHEKLLITIFKLLSIFYILIGIIVCVIVFLPAY